MAALPVVIVGAGPVGLAAAAELIVRGEAPLIFESGAEVGAAMREWAHVRIFSPWRYSIDPAARTLLGADWVAPDPDGHPTGGEIIDGYLAPLSGVPAVKAALRMNARVVGITREGADKMTTSGREELPFALRISTPEGIESVLARAVIDASGTWRSPNPLGADGLRATGEAALSTRIVYRIPDVLGRERARYAGRRVLVVGRGHSAFNVILDLIALQGRAPATEVFWATRKILTSQAFGGGGDDALPERGRLGERVHDLVEDGRTTLLEGFAVRRLDHEGDAVRVQAADGRVVLVDEIIGATGFRPDLTIASELRLNLDGVVEAPAALAPLIDPNLHSCGTVPPHGEAELRHPEKDFYTVGMKSYGRAPTFLMLTGYEQVRSIACALTGDSEGARRVELVLPQTGVCSTGPVLAGLSGKLLQVVQPGAACCGPECCS